MASAALKCDQCGVEFTPIGWSTRGVNRFCSEKCGSKFWSAELYLRRRGPRLEACLECGGELAAYQQKYCSLRCGQYFTGAVRRETERAVMTCALSGCEESFLQRSPKQTCCCEKHGQRHYADRMRASGVKRPYKRTDAARDAEHRRRALKAGAATGQPVKLAYIAERDGYKCHLCSKKVNMKLKAPHPMSPSLDHVIPLSRGGAHDPVNVSLAHLRCNTAKNNRGSGEQLALIG